jgi:hypothetical protein
MGQVTGDELFIVCVLKFFEVMGGKFASVHTVALNSFIIHIDQTGPNMDPWGTPCDHLLVWL